MNIIAMLDRTHKYSKELGKKGSETDILMTHKHIDDGWITFLDPIRYPDKIKGLCKSLNVCNKIFLNVDELDKTLGELILSAHLSNKPGCLFSTIYSKQDIENFIGKTNLKDWPMFDNIDDVLSFCLQPVTETASDELEIAVDQIFPVKGIGTVLLGTVLDGTINVRDTLKLLPSNTFTEVRSIQVHDVDVKTAVNGDRVGLSLKNVNIDKIKTDFVLVGKNNENWLKTEDNIELDFNQDLIKKELPGVIHLSYQMADTVVKVVDQSGKLIVKPENILLYKKGVHGLVYQQDTVPRIVGRFKFL